MTMYRDAYGDRVKMSDKITQLPGGDWLVATQVESGRWEAPCRPHVGGEYYGSLDYVSGPPSAVYRYASKASAVRAAVRLYDLEAVESLAVAS